LPSATPPVPATETAASLSALALLTGSEKVTWMGSRTQTLLEPGSGERWTTVGGAASEMVWGRPPQARPASAGRRRIERRREAMPVPLAVFRVFE
jgi:hypothetical protein